MAIKRKAAIDDSNILIVRVPDQITLDANQRPIVTSYREIPHRTDRGEDYRFSPEENQAFNDFMMDQTIQWTEKNAETSRTIQRDADLYHWWQGFIEGPLRNVKIDSDEFRKSRAGLIDVSLMRIIRTRAQLTIAEFQAMSLAEVFDEISAIHVREHNARNRKAQARKSSSVDHKRLAFYEAQKLAQPTLRYKTAAELWCKKHRDVCDENAFKQSCHRAKKSNKT